MENYCNTLEASIVNYKTIDTQDYNTYNTRTISYYALAEYYQNQFAKRYSNETVFEYLELILSYYQEALENCKGMIKCGQGEFDSKNAEVILLKSLSVYYPMFYTITKEDKYLSAAEACFEELQTKIDLYTDMSMYIDSMLHIARGKILIKNKESLEEAYEILNSLFYYVCKDEEDLCDIGSYMIMSGLATEVDIENIKVCYSQIIEKLEKEKNIQKYVNMVYNAAYCDWLLAYHYQDIDAYEEGYNFLLHLQNVYLDLVENDVKDRILELKKSYENFQEY